MTLHKITEFYTQWFRVFPNIAQNFTPSPYLESCIKQYNDSHKTCRHVHNLLYLPNKCKHSWLVYSGGWRYLKVPGAKCSGSPQLSLWCDGIWVLLIFYSNEPFKIRNWCKWKNHTRSSKLTLLIYKKKPKMFYLNDNNICHCCKSICFITKIALFKVVKKLKLHTTKALGGRGGIAPTHSRPGH
jgi:hypothetical protein